MNDKTKNGIKVGIIAIILILGAIFFINNQAKKIPLKTQIEMEIITEIHSR